MKFQEFLQHRSFRVTERHYVLASQLLASQRFQETLANERRDLAALDNMGDREPHR